VLQVLDDFLFRLRRDGFSVSTTQAIDVARAAREVGFDKGVLREAIACVVVDRAERRPRFNQLFEEFFTPGAPRDLAARLLAQGFSQDEINALQEILEGGERWAALMAGGAGLDHLLARDELQELLGLAQTPSTRGYYVHRLLEALALPTARSALSARLSQELAEAIGWDRAQELMQALGGQLDEVERLVHAELDARLVQAEEERESRTLETAPLTSLSVEEREQVRQAVRRLAERLRGALRVRNRHRRRGRLDPTRTVRRSLASGGVPFAQVRVDRRRERPKLAILCDVSDSVRPVAAFMLELVYALQELFERARSFVFVSDVEEVTRLFEEEPVSTAVARAASSMVGARGNSSYGRALRLFEGRYRDAVDRRTIVVILGDGRTNYQASGAEVLGRIRERAKRVLWLCPEPRAQWGMGDSAMPAYAKQATRVLEVTNAADLEKAARDLVG